MCGFLAILQDAPTLNVARARSALGAIAHRGPDAAGEWCEGSVFLGHRRLSIIDLATGDQPMHSADGRYVIVFNGEIYNFAELRSCSNGGRHSEPIRHRGHSRGVSPLGRGVVRRLNGMFAFVIWDRRTSCAFAARDRLGIKPLCWAMHHERADRSVDLEPFGAAGRFDALIRLPFAT